MVEITKENAIEAGKYYLKLTSKQGKFLGPKDDKKVFAKTFFKYGFANLVSDECFRTILQANPSSLNSLLINLENLENLEYFYEQYGNVSDTILLKLSTDILYNFQETFFSVYKDNPLMLKKMVEKCAIEGKTFDENTLKIIDDLLKKKENKGYDYQFMFDIFSNIIKFSKNDEELKEVIEKYDFFQEEPTTLLHDLISYDTEKTTSFFNTHFSQNLDYQKLMYLLEDAKVMETLKSNCANIKDLQLHKLIETEIEKDIFDDLYKSIFKKNKLKENTTFSKEICLSAIENNIHFLCNEYAISYNISDNGYDPTRLEKAAYAMANYLKETNKFDTLETINNYLGSSNNEIRDTLEAVLYEMKLDTFTFFDKGSNCETYIENTLLTNAKLYYDAKELEKDKNLKVNDKMVEKIAYQLVRFPPQEMLNNEENSRIVFTINNEFAKERMRKKCDVDK